MAEEVEMTPVENAEPPKAPAAPAAPTAIKKPGVTAGLRPGLRLPPKPGATVALKPGLKLPPKPGATVALKPGLKLPPKPGATVALKPGLKLPPKPGLTAALKPGLKLPTKPMIQKPVVGEKPVEKPVAPAPVAEAPKPAPVAEAPKPEPAAEAPKPAPAAEAPKSAPAAEAPKPVPPPIAKPVISKPSASALPKPIPPPVKPAIPKPVVVDAQGVGKLPTVEAKAVPREESAPAEAAKEAATPMEQLKAATQTLKGLTQEIPAQAVLRKTGIIADGVMSEAQKEAAKHKTARISLSEAIGVSPVKNEMAPMKTIRIRRPIDIPNATKPLAPQVKPASVAAPKPVDTQAETVAQAPKVDVPAEEAPTAATAAPTITQRKTLKIARPGGGMVRPSGKFGIKRPGATAAAKPAEGAPAPAEGAAAAEGEAPVAEIADIPEIPALPTAPEPSAKVAASDGPMWLFTLSSLVQAAACVAMGVLAWFLYQNTQIAYF